MDVHDIICKSCRQKVGVDEVRYSDDGQELLCHSCYERRLFEPAANCKTARIKFICSKCRYKFSRSPDSRMGKNCPYCNSSDVVEDKGSAEDILHDVREHGDFFRL